MLHLQRFNRNAVVCHGHDVTHVLACLWLLLLLLLQVKAKGARKITYEAFLKALDHVAAKKVRRTELRTNCTARQLLTASA
jgi:hypothetical protein